MKCKFNSILMLSDEKSNFWSEKPDIFRPYYGYLGDKGRGCDTRPDEVFDVISIDDRKVHLRSTSSFMEYREITMERHTFDEFSVWV